MTGWASPEEIAAVCGVSRHTVRTWARRGQIPAACDVKTRRLLVWWPAADRRAERLRRCA